MSYEHKKAIERIIIICESSRQPTKRIERIYDIALESMGLVEGQRNQLLLTLKQRAVQLQRNRNLKREQRSEE